MCSTEFYFSLLFLCRKFYDIVLSKLKAFRNILLKSVVEFVRSIWNLAGSHIATFKVEPSIILKKETFLSFASFPLSFFWIKAKYETVTLVHMLLQLPGPFRGMVT